MPLKLPKLLCWHRNSGQNMIREDFIRTTSFVVHLFHGEPRLAIQSWSYQLENDRIGTTFHKCSLVFRSPGVLFLFLPPRIMPIPWSSWYIEWLMIFPGWHEYRLSELGTVYMANGPSEYVLSSISLKNTTRPKTCKIPDAFEKWNVVFMTWKIGYIKKEATQEAREANYNPRF